MGGVPRCGDPLAVVGREGGHLWQDSLQAVGPSHASPTVWVQRENACVAGIVVFRTDQIEFGNFDICKLR